MRIFYEQKGDFPKKPFAGLGVVDATGKTTVPDGFDSFEVEKAALLHGNSNVEIEELYLVTAAGVLTPRTQTAVEAIRASWTARAQAKQRRYADSEQRLKNIMTNDAIRRITTLADAENLVNSSVRDLSQARDMMAKLLYAVVNVSRILKEHDDSLFPDDE